jgi:hypothetical protein
VTGVFGKGDKIPSAHCGKRLEGPMPRIASAILSCRAIPWSPTPPTPTPSVTGPPARAAGVDDRG